MRPYLSAVLAAALLAPATAGASTAALSSGTLTLTGAGTENNDFDVRVEISPINSALTGVIVKDTGVPYMQPSTSCVNRDPQTLFCRTTSFKKLTANLGAGNDRLVRNNDIQFIPWTVDLGAGDDFLVASRKRDTIKPGAGADVIDAGGDDILDLRSETAPVIADGEAGTVTHQGTTDTVSGFRFIYTGSGADDISGFDTVYAGKGDDTLRATATRVTDPDGNDYLQGQQLYGEDGNDTLLGGDGNDIIDGGLGTDVMIGGGGFDIVTYAGRAGAIFLQQNSKADDGIAGENDSIAGFEHLRSSYGNDLIKGGGGAVILDGQAGRDRLLGGVLAETLLGGTGDDQLYGGDTSDADTLDCGSGNDEYVNRDGDTLKDCEIDYEAAQGV